MSDPISTIVSRGAAKLNIELPPKAGAAFRVYYDFLEKCGMNVNLTAISGAQEVARLHFLDSIALLKAANFTNKSVIDIGSGAGFPGIPLKIAEPSIKLTLLEATGIRATFLSGLSAKLGIDSVCKNTRAEEAAHCADMREQYDIVVSRAVARLNVLCELCLPFLKPGGIFLAMKSTDCSDETKEAKNAADVLGAEYLEHHDYTIPDTDITHRVIRIQKLTKTPDEFPRRFAKIQKSPL